MEIIISRAALKQLKKLPTNVSDSLYYWITTVKTLGLYETRRISGYHDEPLRGDRIGQRSIRLNKSYRAFYFVNQHTEIIITIIEVNKHEY